MKDVLALTHRLRDSEDTALASIASSLSTRQLIRIAKRLKQFPEEDAHHAIHKACLARSAFYSIVSLFRRESLATESHLASYSFVPFIV
jgi:hypothetical protein